MKRTAVALAFAFLAVPAVHAQGIVDPSVSGDTLTARIELAGGIGADLTIAFERAVGLTPAALGLSAVLVSPTDSALLSRLPQANVSIPGAFPVLLTIEPPATGGLSFSGLASVSLHTHNLPFAPDTPLRLFRATGGGRFEDVTETMGMGSYRVRGSSGGFSQWLIVADVRQINSVIGKKFDRLEDLLATHEGQIAPAVYSDLADHLVAARAAHDANALVAAAQEVEAFAAAVQEHSGGIPDVWRSAGDLVNVAGVLRAAASTLRFSLNLKSNSGGGLL